MIRPLGARLLEAADWLATERVDGDLLDPPQVEEIERDLREAAAALGQIPQWQPIESAPKGSWLEGPNDTRDPAYVEPPHVWLLLANGQRCVGYADAYYAEGGNGYDGGSFWVEGFSAERVTPTHWMPLPNPPKTDPGEGGR